MRLDRRLLGWGLFFILLGAIPLALNGGLIDRSLVERWPSIWPLLLIGWGVGLVLRRTPVEWVGGAVSAITLGVMGGGLIVTGVSGFPSISSCGAGTGGAAFSPVTGNLESDGRVAISFDCGTLTVRAADGAGWAVEGNEAQGRPPVVTRDAAGLAIAPADARTDVFRWDRGSTSWTVTVPRTPTLDVLLTLNAGQGAVDLTGARLGSVTTTVNAGALTRDLAGAVGLTRVTGTVNAGTMELSLPAYDGTATLTANVGKLTLCLPQDAVFRVHWGGALGNNDLAGLGLTKVDSDTWETASYAAASRRIDMNVSANAGQFGLQIGGTCGA